VKRLY